MTEFLCYGKWTYPQNAVVFLADEIVKNKGPIQGSINMFILSTSWQGLGSVVTRVVLAVVTNGEMESTGVVIFVTEDRVDSTKGFSRRNVPKQQCKTNIKIIKHFTQIVIFFHKLAVFWMGISVTAKLHYMHITYNMYKLLSQNVTLSW